MCALMLNDRSTTIDLLLTRRSGKPRDMVAPGPNATEMEAILTAALRVPDHGKIAPWRFVVIPADARAAFADAVDRAWLAEGGNPDDKERGKLREFATQAPELVVVLSVPDRAHKIPIWEQEMSAGAACQNLLLAATARGFVGGWLTGWAAYSPGVYAALGGEQGGRVAGFVFLGTPARELEERPRPMLAQVARVWAPQHSA